MMDTDYIASLIAVNARHGQDNFDMRLALAIRIVREVMGGEDNAVSIAEAFWYLTNRADTVTPQEIVNALIW